MSVMCVHAKPCLTLRDPMDCSPHPHLLCLLHWPPWKPHRSIIPQFKKKKKRTKNNLRDSFPQIGFCSKTPIGLWRKTQQCLS